MFWASCTWASLCSSELHTHGMLSRLSVWLCVVIKRRYLWNASGYSAAACKNLSKMQIPLQCSGTCLFLGDATSTSPLYACEISLFPAVLNLFVTYTFPGWAEDDCFVLSGTKDIVALMLVKVPFLWREKAIMHITLKLPKSWLSVLQQ